MTDHTYIIILLIISFSFLSINFVFNGRKDVYTYAISFYFFFTCGPVLNHLLGLPIYFGIPIQYIPQAVLIFTISICTMCTTSLLLQPKESTQILPPTGHYQILSPILIVFIAYACIQSMYVISFSIGASKIEKINLLIPKIHYNYLLIETYLVSFFFFIKKKTTKKIYWLNFFTYITYCLITGERDFIFPLTSISLHMLIFTKVSKKAKIGILGSIASFFFIATAIFFIRDKSQVQAGILNSILNQGSLLFINSYTIQLLDQSYEFFNGFTYLNSFQNLLPSWIYKTNFNSLSWFKNNYAPMSNSGYGFGLDAEGYMNFGHIGVVFTFIFVTVIQKFTIRNINTKDFFKYYSVFYICFLMYSFRNDSLAFFKGNLYAIIFFFLIKTVSTFIYRITHSGSHSNIRI